MFKAALGSGATAPSRTSALGLNNYNPGAAVLDPTSGYSFIGDSNSIIKLATHTKNSLKPHK